MSSSQHPDPTQMNRLLQNAATQLGMAPQAVQPAVQSGSADALLKVMRPEDAAKLRAALADQKTTAQILASPQAKALLQKLFGGTPPTAPKG